MENEDIVHNIFSQAEGVEENNFHFTSSLLKCLLLTISNTDGHERESMNFFSSSCMGSVAVALGI
jgi:hypothetical protein